MHFKQLLLFSTLLILFGSVITVKAAAIPTIEEEIKKNLEKIKQCEIQCMVASQQCNEATNNVEVACEHMNAAQKDLMEANKKIYKKIIASNKRLERASLIFKYLAGSIGIAYLFYYKKGSDTTFKELVSEIQKRKIPEEAKTKLIKQAQKFKYFPNRKTIVWLIGTGFMIGGFVVFDWLAKNIQKEIRETEDLLRKCW